MLTVRICRKPGFVRKLLNIKKPYSDTSRMVLHGTSQYKFFVNQGFNFCEMIEKPFVKLVELTKPEVTKCKQTERSISMPVRKN